MVALEKGDSQHPTPNTQHSTNFVDRPHKFLKTFRYAFTQVVVEWTSYSSRLFRQWNSPNSLLMMTIPRNLNMIERINSQSGFRALLFQTAQAALAEIPRKLSAGSRQISAAKPLRLHSWQRSIESEPYSWLFERRGTAQDRLTIIPGGAETKSADDGLNPRHWLTNNNPRLGHLVSETIGDRWITHAEDLQQLAPIADRPFFQSRWQQVKRANKQALARHLYRLQGIEIDVNSLFDLR